MSTPVPLIDLELTAQFFGAETPAERAELRSMYNDLAPALVPRLEALLAQAESPATSSTATRDLHQLRGVAANFGLSRAASALGELERSWDETSGAARRATLQAALADVHAGLAELARVYPYLA